MVPEHAEPPVTGSTVGQLAPAPCEPDELPTDSHPIAGTCPDGGLIYVPFMRAWGASLTRGAAPGGIGVSERAGLTLPHDVPFWFGAGGGGTGPQSRARADGAGPGSLLSGVRGSAIDSLPQVTFLPPSTGGNTTGETTSQTAGKMTGEATRQTTADTTGLTTGETTGQTTTGDTGGSTTGTTTGDFVTTVIAVGETTGGGSPDTGGSVPEPATWTLLGLGACAAVARAWRAHRR